MGARARAGPNRRSDRRGRALGQGRARRARRVASACIGAPARAACEDVLCGADGLDGLQRGRTHRHEQPAPRGPAALRARGSRRGERSPATWTPACASSPRASSMRSCSPAPGSNACASSPRSGRCSTPSASSRRPGRALSHSRDASATSVPRLPWRDSSTRTAQPVCSPSAPLQGSSDASCRTPLGACAMPAGSGRLRLRAWVGLPDGSAWARDELPGLLEDPESPARELARRLKLVGAGEMLARAEEMARVGNA